MKPAFEIAHEDAMAIKASMGMVVKDFLGCSDVATRDADAMHDGFKVVTSKTNSRVYTRRSAHPTLKECLTIGRTHDMSIEDVGYLMYSDTNDQFRTDQAIFYEHNFQDAYILQTIHKRTEDEPYHYFGVKYKQISIPSSGLAEVRDTVFFEYMGMTQDSVGHRVFFVVRDSEYLQNVIPTPGIVRLQFRTLQIFTEVDGGTVEFVSRSFMNPNGILPAWMCNRQLVRYASIIESLPIALQYKRFLEKVKRQPSRRMRKNFAKTCIVCNTKMTVFNFKALYNCMYCGEIICAKCVVPVPRAFKKGGATTFAKDDFCKRCFVEGQSFRDSRGSSEFKSSVVDMDSSSVTSSTQDEVYESYLSSCNAVAKPTIFAKESSPDQVAVIPDAPIDFSQLQTSIEEQKALVSQMQQRLEARSQYYP
ncbi:hypothetical protein AeMF1_001333 [Aphanomyces euteiches]|nr:hypothetical protein AeMF1_001333 [Aphanomyces euteiches]KAH9189620.1 hypothetical protein AeNC1_008400 [Aphanomyces euteiches]